MEWIWINDFKASGHLPANLPFYDYYNLVNISILSFKYIFNKRQL